MGFNSGFKGLKMSDDAQKVPTKSRWIEQTFQYQYQFNQLTQPMSHKHGHRRDLRGEGEHLLAADTVA